tara:strand:- start:190 stop:729 length:540 start_codon:yes stop_codon:yes gene_type:complete
MKFYSRYFEAINKKILEFNETSLNLFVKKLIDVKKNKKKVIIVGNGGSAAIASHVSVDLTKACKIRSVNFNEADLITCFANDYGYENWVKKGVDFYADKKDLLICISSSGMSKNIINGAKQAKKIGCDVVTLSGFSKSNSLKKQGHINLWVNSTNYNIVEMTHHIWLLSVVDLISKSKF